MLINLVKDRTFWRKNCDLLLDQAFRNARQPDPSWPVVDRHIDGRNGLWPRLGYGLTHALPKVQGVFDLEQN